ncbi:MAG: (d)CMP kinase [Defluviitaleaceae bacterium]|nr:(d)CMP kinase [Defluviitaleaceae bacterium]
MICIRGATTVTENTAEAILAATSETLQEMMKQNDCGISQIISIVFSATKDLDAVYPARAARELGITEAGLFCVQEMDVPGSLPMCIRLMMHVDVLSKGQYAAKHVYSQGAQTLRPDITNNEPAPKPTTPPTRPPEPKSKRPPRKKPPQSSIIAIAIDGPSGAGKSTVAKAVAEELGIMYVDTGAMYRAVALNCIKDGVKIKDESAVQKIMQNISIDIFYDQQGRQRVVLNGEEVTEQLHSQKVADATSVIATYSKVREYLVAIQQEIATKQSVVMDGRDIGTKVLPFAQVKIFLDATLEERARRRLLEFEAKGETATLATVINALKLRDRRDKSRANSPLMQADDAVYIKSDGVPVPQIVQQIVAELHKS